jgi:hypothetical protein
MDVGWTQKISAVLIEMGGTERRTKMKRRVIIVVVVLCVGAFLGVAEKTSSEQAVGGTEMSTEAAGGEAQAHGMDSVARVLVVFLVLSIVFEVALTPLFNWRVFMARFEGKGYKTPITVALAFIVFWGYGLDIIKDLLVALGKPASQSIGGQILTALLIAGGSSGVYQIFTKLKIRMDSQEREKKTAEARAFIGARKGSASKTP